MPYFLFFLLLSTGASADVECPEGTKTIQGKSESGFKATWCEKEEGVKDGPFVEHYPDGTLRGELFYADGKKNGSFRIWFESGQIETEGSYRNNLAHNDWTRWYQNGEKRDQGDWKNGLPEGSWRAWYQNGNKRFKGSYVHGKEQGNWLQWYPSGQLKSEGRYEQGEKVCEWTYWSENQEETVVVEKKREDCETTLSIRRFEIFIQGISFTQTDSVGGIGIGWAPSWAISETFVSQFRSGLVALGPSRETTGPKVNVTVIPASLVLSARFGAIQLGLGPLVEFWLGEGAQWGWEFEFRVFPKRKVLGFIESFVVSLGYLKIANSPTFEPYGKSSELRLGFSFPL